LAPDPEIIDERRSHSETTLREFRKHLARVPELKESSDFCIYATGSYARGEASEHSDLDLFFVDKSGSCSRTTTTLISAEVIRIARALQLPEFSGDGAYLKLHKLSDMKDYLGGAKDDYENLFTARLLLLLESVPVGHPRTYHQVLRSVVQSYYRDYHDHNAEFVPVFLANDIIRFWKTLCLNYEHKRNSQSKAAKEKNKAHLKNLKLKFSRMTTCFSTILAIASAKETIGPDALIEIIRLSPLQRLRSVAETTPGGAAIYSRLIKEYDWFLQRTGAPESDVLRWISDRDARRDAFSRAKRYGSGIFKLLTKATASDETFRYLLI
jgi:predicted nucleotidyltransferase